jgi:DNA repair photolyase
MEQPKVNVPPIVKLTLHLRPQVQFQPPVQPQPPVKTVVQMLSENPSRSVWSVILEQNTHDKNLLGLVVMGQITSKQFKSMTSERLKGQWQFGMASYNIRRSKFACKHKCTYCYVTPLFQRWGNTLTMVDIEDVMPVDCKKVNKSWSPTNNVGRTMYFFPSTSDVFEENAQDYVTVCSRIIDAGHEVFFVTKPTMRSIQAIVNAFKSTARYELYRQKMVVFVTISTDDDQILRRFEPCSSLFEERIQVLRYLISEGFNTNVMMEPYLSDPIPVIEKLQPFDGVIAVGRMNYTNNIHFDSDPQKDLELKQYLANLYTPTNYRRLWEYVKDRPSIYLKKDSIDALLKMF